MTLIYTAASLMSSGLSPAVATLGQSFAIAIGCVRASRVLHARSVSQSTLTEVGCDKCNKNCWLGQNHS